MMTWSHAGQEHRAQWRCEAIANAPQRVLVIDDTMKADVAYRLACDGTTLLWKGDFQNARLLLQAIARRVDAQRDKTAQTQRTRAARQLKAANAAGAAQAAAAPEAAAVHPMAALYYRHRQSQAHRARVLSSLVVILNADYTMALRRAPDWQEACTQAWGAPDTSAAATSIAAPLRELLGMVGAFEWRKTGVEIPALGAAPHPRIHPHYGVFSPIRGEYIAAVAQAPLPASATAAGGVAWDIGTGSGVLAAVLARRGVGRIIATDQDPRALACARDNIQRLGFAARVQVQQMDVFPAGQADLIVCNPPWLPGKPSSALEHAVYDPESRMLRTFIAGLASHLAPGGQGWLVLSDLAEHLGLRSREQLLEWIQAAGLTVLDRIDVRPTHPKATDTTDPLHTARAAEITSLWQLTVRA